MQNVTSTQPFFLKIGQEIFDFCLQAYIVRGAVVKPIYGWSWFEFEKAAERVLFCSDIFCSVGITIPARVTVSSNINHCGDI